MIVTTCDTVPGREINKNLAGKVLEGRDRNGGVLPSWLMSRAKKELNDLAGSQRAFCQGNCAPNHYWNTKENKPDFPALFEQMEREVKTYGIDSWKWYCHTDPGKSGKGLRLDDEKLSYPIYEKSKKLGRQQIEFRFKKVSGLLRRAKEYVMHSCSIGSPPPI